MPRFIPAASLKQRILCEGWPWSRITQIGKDRSKKGQSGIASLALAITIEYIYEYMSGSGSIGQLFEKIAGLGQKAKKTVELSRGMKPVFSLESRFSLEKLKEVVDAGSERLFSLALPALGNKVVLEVGEGPLRYLKAIQAKKPKMVCGCLVNESAETGGDGTSLLCRGSFRTFPFEEKFFDWAVVRLASPLQGDLISTFKEMGRVLAPEAEGLIIDYHPFGLFAKSGTPRLRSVEATIRGIEGYYKMCRMALLGLVDLHEIFIDEPLRGLFVSTEELNGFREVKGTPLLIALHLKKGRGGK